MGIFYARIGCQATENQGFRTACGGGELKETIEPGTLKFWKKI
jgi:hypothetical protein